ncbi:hypothetical protein PENTCL1PPCAC_8021, partial [Pristionchus entomophagus]
MKPGLCDAPKERQFKNAISISEDDHFSVLQSDCVLHIFSFLNQTDLDILSPVSQTINHYVNWARPTVPRSRLFDAVKLKHSGLNAFNLQLIGQDREKALTWRRTGDSYRCRSRSITFASTRLAKSTLISLF